jgi:c(7)-type cytochrome triheme protein
VLDGDGLFMEFAGILRIRPALVLAFAFFVWFQWSGNAAMKDAGIVAYPNAPGAPGPVMFSHLSHGIKRTGYSCENCHPAGSDKSLVVTMNDIRQGRVCGECHDGRTIGPRNKHVAAAIKDCQACHMPAHDVVIKLNRMDPVTFSHIRHLAVDPDKRVFIRAGFSCADCHATLFERASEGRLGMEVPHEKGACAQCHNGKKRSDGIAVAFPANTRCLTCHKTP